MYYVVKELKSVNANASEKFPPENSVKEPIYWVLEDPREIEEKNTKDEKFWSFISRILEMIFFDQFLSCHLNLEMLVYC